MDKYQAGAMDESTPPAKKPRNTATSNGVKIEKNEGDSESHRQFFDCASSCPSSPNSVPDEYEDSQRSPKAVYNCESQPLDLDYRYSPLR